MKQIKSDVSFYAGTKELSTNRIQKTYIYVYVDDVISNRLMKKHNKERMVGWTQYDSDSVVIKGEHSHLWVYNGFWKRNKPVKRVKMGE